MFITLPKKKTRQEFIDKARQVHGDKYDYSRVEYINSYTKVKIICPIHDEFEQRPVHHLRGCDCPYCVTNTKSSKEEFEEKARKIHGNWYNYDYVDYQTAHTLVTIVCPQHGPFEQKPNDHLNGIGCYKCGMVNRDGFYHYQWLKENLDKHNEPCVIYLIEMFNDEERFLKFGIT